MKGVSDGERERDRERKRWREKGPTNNEIETEE